MKFILTLLALFIGQSIAKQCVSTNNPIMKNDIADTWNYNLIALLKKAQNGDDSALNAYVHQFVPFTAVSGNQSKLWVLRPFRIADYSGQRQILSERPDSDDFQWGITVASLINNRSVVSHLHLPYGKDFSGLQVDNMDVEILMVDGTSIETNEAELFFKLSGKYKTEDIDRAFASLCNKQYPEPVRISTKDIP